MEIEAPYTCQFCGAPTWYAPIDQTPPPDYCHESDHGEPPECVHDWGFCCENSEGTEADFQCELCGAKKTMHSNSNSTTVKHHKEGIDAAIDAAREAK